MSSNEVHRYVLAYDVADDTRRVRVAKTLESYGDRIQYSVFLVDTRPARMLRLRAAVADLIEPTTDSLLVCDLGPVTGSRSGKLDYVGATRSITGSGPLVL